MTNKPMLSVELRAGLERLLENGYAQYLTKIDVVELRALLDKPEDCTQSALQLAYELGGTDEGNYFLNEEELLQVIWQHTNSQASEEPFAWVRECVVGEAFGSIMSFTCNKEDVTEHHEPVYKSTSDIKYRAELYDEVWELARKLGYNNVTDALSVTPIKE